MFNRNVFLSVSLASAMMVAGANVAFACDDKSPRERASHLKKELNLTDDQTKKIESIMANSMKKHDQLREDTRKEVRDVLTDEQKTKYDEMKAKHKKEKKEKKDY